MSCILGVFICVNPSFSISCNFFSNIFGIFKYFSYIRHIKQLKNRDYMDRLQQLEIEVQALKQKISELESILDTIYYNYMDKDKYSKRNYWNIDNHINR